MSELHNCKHCFAPITNINYLLGRRWMHYNPDASFPTVGKGTLWEYCKLTVAEPK